MSYNKNGLEIKLNFDQSLNAQDLQDIKEPTFQNQIESNISSVFFLPKPKEIQMQKYSYNFLIISNIKAKNTFIINKTSKFELINKSQKNKEFNKESLEIIKLTEINLINLNNENKNDIAKTDEIAKKDENEAQNDKKKEEN